MDVNLKLKLLGNIPIPIKDICLIYSLTLSEIISIGIDEYETMLSNLIIDPKQLLKDSEDMEEITTFDIIIYNILNCKDGQYINYILKAIKMFIKEEVSFVCPNKADSVDVIKESYFVIGEQNESNRFLNREDYAIFKEILLCQNCLNNNDNKEEYNPANEDAKNILSKINKSKEKMKKLKEDREGKMSLSDIISTVAAKSSNLNIIEIMKLSIYQLYDQLDRIQMIEEYEMSIKSLLAGANPDEIKVQHYLRPKK